MKQGIREYFEISDYNKNTLFKCLVSDSSEAWNIFCFIDNHYPSLDLDSKIDIFFDKCKERGVAVALFRNSDRYFISM